MKLEKYDAFKRDTLDYTNNYLAPVEEKIHDAEIQLDKFQFSGAQSDIDDAHELMDKYEVGINNKLKTLMKLFLYIRKMNKFMKSARLIIEK